MASKREKRLAKKYARQLKFFCSRDKDRLNWRQVLERFRAKRKEVRDEEQRKQGVAQDERRQYAASSSGRRSGIRFDPYGHSY